MVIKMVYTLQEIKNKISPIVLKYNIPSVYIFGSYARGTANEASDVDFLIDTTGTELKSMFKLGKLFDELHSVLGKEIDLITVSSLQQKPLMQSDVLFYDNIISERVNLDDVA